MAAAGAFALAGGLVALAVFLWIDPKIPIGITDEDRARIDAAQTCEALWQLEREFEWDLDIEYGAFRPLAEVQRRAAERGCLTPSTVESN